jgi:curli biogenesis system outer membrane secretion channel CsgG
VEEDMRKVFWSLCVVTLGLLLVSAGPAAAQGKASRPTVAVMDFDFGSVQHWWDGNWDIGKGIADLVVDELVNDGSYRMIERKKLQDMLAEQDFSNSDRADPSAAQVAKVGKMLGVKYMVVGSITKFGTEQSSKGVNAGGWGGGKYGVGKVGTQKGKASVAITARIIEISTGEIIASAKGEGVSTRSGVLLGGGGGGGAGAAGGIEMGSSDYRDSILGEATDAAVKQVTAKLIAAKTRFE